jgi:hypothetical protein
MPQYLYQHPKSKKVIELIQSVHDNHEYIDSDGLKWNRVYTAPELNTEGSLKADCTAKQFDDYTGRKKGTIGDLWDRSAELSDKRKKIYGEDPVKKDYLKSWKSKRKNKRHPTLDN